LRVKAPSGEDPILLKGLYTRKVVSGYNVYVVSIYDLEVDFIIEKEERKEYYQIYYLLSNDDLVNREYRNLQRINNNYRKTVISLDDISFGNQDGIEHILSGEFL
jgi:uncharacterized protein